MMMSPGAVISGRITDRGQAVALAEAVAIRAISTEGRLSFTPVLATRTNDLGEYSLFWLPPGRYYILAIVWDSPNAAVHYVTPDGTDNNSYATQRFIGRAVFMRTPSSGIADNEAHVPIYYPGTSDPQLANAIEVSPGAEIRGINIDAGPVALGRVRGTVTGMPATSVDMRPLTWTIYTAPAQRPNANVNSVGGFEMSAVPGRYTLTAFGSGRETYTIVDVRAGGVTNAVVSLSPGLTIQGRILIERASPVRPDPALPSLRVALRPDPLAPGVSSFVSSPLEPDGSFTIPEGTDTGPPEGDFRVLVEPLLLPPTQPGATPRSIPASLENLYVKSIRMGEIDVFYDRLHLTSQTQGPLTIVIGTNPELSAVESWMIATKRCPEQLLFSSTTMDFDFALMRRSHPATAQADSNFETFRLEHTRFLHGMTLRSGRGKTRSSCAVSIIVAQQSGSKKAKRFHLM